MSGSHRKTRERPSKQQFAENARKRIHEQLESGSPRVDLSQVFPAEESLSNDIGERVRQINVYHPDYSWEFVRQALHQLLLTRMPKDQIAKKFDVSLPTIHRWVRQMKEEWREEAITLDPREIFMEQLENYKAASASAWREYYAAKTLRDRQVSMALVMKANEAIDRLYANAGVIHEQVLQPSRYDDAHKDTSSGVPLLTQMARTFLSGPGEDVPESEHEEKRGGYSHEDMARDLEDSRVMDAEVVPDKKTATIPARKRPRPRPPKGGPK